MLVWNVVHDQMMRICTQEQLSAGDTAVLLLHYQMFVNEGLLATSKLAGDTKVNGICFHSVIKPLGK